jgi:hypothetical protein
MNVLFESENFPPTVFSIMLLYDIDGESYGFIYVLRRISYLFSSNQIKDCEHVPDWGSQVILLLKQQTKYPHASIPNIILSLQPKSPDTSTHKHPNNNSKIKTSQPQPYPKAT